MAQDYTVEQLNHGRRVYDFMRVGNIAFILSMGLVIAAIVIMIIKGFNWGLDFTGGSVIEVKLSQPVGLEQIRSSLENANFHDPIIQNFGSSKDIMIRLAPVAELDNATLAQRVIEAVQGVDAKASQRRIEFVGPAVGAELAESGVMAIIVCLISILIYLGIRFEWRLAAGTVFALAHDVIITLGIISFFQLEVDLTIIASLLSVIGYSLNDSIVVFDRMRENFRKIRRGTAYEIMNISLTQTLSRTLMTSGTTLMVVLCLYFFGGSLIKGFSETLSIGIVLGTFSSIWVAAYVALKLGVDRKHLLVKKIEKEGAEQPPLIR